MSHGSWPKQLLQSIGRHTAELLSHGSCPKQLYVHTPTPFASLEQTEPSAHLLLAGSHWISQYNAGSFPVREMSQVGVIPDACFCVQVMHGGHVPGGSVGLWAGLMHGGAQMQPELFGETVARRPPYLPDKCVSKFVARYAGESFSDQ